MTSSLIIIFYEFLKIGIFAIGGGYATIPFLFHLIDEFHWFGINQLTNMIAISNMTPGPVGINMATYAGYSVKGVIGGICATCGIVLGPFIITLITIYFLNKFRENKLVNEILEGLKPTSIALLTLVLLQLITQNFFRAGIINPKAIIITIILAIAYKYLKKQPSLIILLGGVLGFVVNIF